MESEQRRVEVEQIEIFRVSALDEVTSERHLPGELQHLRAVEIELSEHRRPPALAANSRANGVEAPIVPQKLLVAISIRPQRASLYRTSASMARCAASPRRLPSSITLSSSDSFIERPP